MIRLISKIKKAEDYNDLKDLSLSTAGFRFY